MTGEATAAEVRIWAQGRFGDAVPGRGKLSKQIIDGYNAAHPERPYRLTVGDVRARRSFALMNDAAKCKSRWTA